MKNICLVAIVFLLVFSSCDNSDVIIVDPPVETPGDASDFQKMIIDFGLSTFQKAVDEGDDNVLISPLSLETALYMAMNGSNGETLEEFRIALKADAFYPTDMNPFYKDLMDKLAPKNESTTLGLANTVFYDETMVTFLESYEDIIKDVFDGTFNQADFKDSGSVDLINNWAKDKTENRIEKILDKIEPDEALFLINALFFKADWEKGFEELATMESIFTKENDETVLVDLMYSDDIRAFYQGDEFSAVDLKFTDNEYSMSFILPKDNLSISDFINGYSESEFYEFYNDLYANKLREDRILTRIPKFEIEAHKNMKDILKKMGLETAFNDADLSKMGAFQGNTYISRVLHDTFLKIDEKGAEGAAVTTVGIGVESLPPSIDFNRPFLFIIRHVETNIPIFIGKLGDPN